MSRSKILSLILLLTLSLISCSRRDAVDEAPELQVDMAIIPSPPKAGPSLLMIHIYNVETGEIGDFTIDVRGDMSHAGMTPVIISEAKGKNGTYAVPFEWTMAGDWIVTITATLPDGRNLMRTLPVQVEL